MKCQREKFYLQRKYAYLNCAYMSPVMKKVENAGIKGIKKKRKPYRISTEDFFNDGKTARLLFSKLIDNPAPDRVAITPSVSYGMATVANNIDTTPGKIIVVEDQFPSNVLHWKKLESNSIKLQTIAAPDSEKRGQEWNARLLEAIDEETKVVAIGHVHWSDGTIFQLRKIRDRLDEVGGLLVIDGTQSVGALPFSVQQIRPDALVCGAYKFLMGPYSIGLAYYGEAFDNGTPIEENWINRANSDVFAQLSSYEPNYRSLSQRYQVGENSNFILLPMLIEALKQLLKWDPAAVQLYCKDLMHSSLQEIAEMGYSIDEPSSRSHHLFGIAQPQEVSHEALQQALKKHKVSISTRGSYLRVSPNVYNDEMDVRKLLKALKEPILALK